MEAVGGFDSLGRDCWKWEIGKRSFFLCIEFADSFFKAAKCELQEETGLTALNLQLKGISGFTNPDKGERYVYYDFLCTAFEVELISHSCEGLPKWWKSDGLDDL